MVGLLTLVLVPQMVAPPAAAQAISDPWWGPSSRADPTAGWAVRVPVVVENKFDYAIFRPTVVAVDIDFGALLVKAGWTSQVLGTEERLRGFTLDVDSIRVVEYQPGFNGGPLHGPSTKPTPHVFYTSPFYAEKYREFDPARNPSGTVLFTLDGGLGLNAKRFFYVYANPLEYGKTEPAEFKLDERAPLDAFLWGSTGTVHYGWEPNQEDKTNRILVKSLTSQKTTITLYERDFGRFVPSRSTPTSQNPQEISFGSATFFVPGGKAFKIVASHPVVVYGHGKLTQLEGTQVTGESYGYFPSLDGDFAGTGFWIYGFRKNPGDTGANVQVIKSGAGSVNVQMGAQSATLTNAQPTTSFSAALGMWSFLSASGPVLVRMTDTSRGIDPDRPLPTYQVPALTGGPSGIDFRLNLPRDGGVALICPEAYTGIRIVDVNRPDFQVIPEGPRDTTAPLLLHPSPGCTPVKSTPTLASESGAGFHAYAIGGEVRYPIEDAPVPFRLIVGAEGRNKASVERGMVGHYGGLAGVDFRVSGKTGVFAFFNNTRVTVYEELRDGGNVNYTFTLSEDGFQPLSVSKSDTRTGRYQIVTSKPATVVSADDYGHPYSRSIPGLPNMPRATVGLAEFRGPLVELRSPETTGRQLYRSTGPETPITFRLEALNIGRWMNGEASVDAISIHCTGPAEWDIAGCGREFNVASGNAERFDVTVTPSAADVNKTSFIEIEARSATSGITSTFRLAIYVEIRYGVGLWFDVENGRKTIDPILGVDPGQTHAYAVVIKNTGSAADTFRVTVDDPKETWKQRLTYQGDPVRELRLAGGESRVLTFEVTAPDAESAPQNLVSITAESLSSDLASAKDIINTATRIRPKVNIKLEIDPPTRVAEPNETAQFNLTVTNRGNDVFTIKIREDSIIPTGWKGELGLPGGEVSLNPNANYTFPYRATPPLGARAGDLVTIKLSAQTDTGGGGALIPGDEVSAVVVVKRIHNVTTPPLLDARAAPGETIRYVLPLANHGNGDDVVELLPGADTAWATRALEQALVLGLDETGEMPLEIRIPRGAAPGIHNLTVTLRLSREAAQTVVIPFDIAAVARLGVTGPSAVDAAPARGLPLALDVENVGNLAANFTLGTSAPDGWNVTFTPSKLRLEPGARAKVAAILNVSRDAQDGGYALNLTATTESGLSAGDKPVSVRVARPNLVIDAIKTSGDLAAGEVIIVSATIKNDGGIAAEDVRVALVVDGEPVDQVTLGRVPVGQSQVATLNWLATRRGADVRVVIDPEETMVLGTRDQTGADVTFGRTLGIPAPDALLVLSMLGVAALATTAHRRRRS